MRRFVIAAAVLVVLGWFGYQRLQSATTPECMNMKVSGSRAWCDPRLLHVTARAGRFFGEAAVWSRPGLPLKDAVGFLGDAGYRCKLPEDDQGRMPEGIGELSTSCVNENGEGWLDEKTELSLKSRYEITREGDYEVRLEPALTGIDAKTERSNKVPRWLRRLMVRLHGVPPETEQIRGWVARDADHLASALRQQAIAHLHPDFVTPETRALKYEPEEPHERLRLGLQAVDDTPLPAAHVCHYTDAFVRWGI